MDKTTRYVLFAIGLVMLLFAEDLQATPQSVAQIQGIACSEAEDCPCYGTTEGGIVAKGIGVGRCVEEKCDVTYCFDIEPAEKWLKEKPIQWVKLHPWWTLAAIGCILAAIFWPKQ